MATPQELAHEIVHDRIVGEVVNAGVAAAGIVRELIDAGLIQGVTPPPSPAQRLAEAKEAHRLAIASGRIPERLDALEPLIARLCDVVDQLQDDVQELQP